jgi:uncharacterized membrane protein YqjE
MIAAAGRTRKWLFLPSTARVSSARMWRRNVVNPFWKVAEMITTTVVLLLLGAALAVYLNDKNGKSSSLWAQWERELKTTRKTHEDA